jgi:hypothetical protein
VAGAVEIHEVDGDHGNILNDPQVKLLAAQIRARLETAQSETRNTLPSLSVSQNLNVCHGRFQNVKR